MYKLFHVLCLTEQGLFETLELQKKISLKNVVDPGMQHHLPVLQQTASVSSEDSGTSILNNPIKLSKEHLNLEAQAFYSLSFNASKMTFGQRITQTANGLWIPSILEQELLHDRLLSLLLLHICILISSCLIFFIL